MQNETPSQRSVAPFRPSCVSFSWILLVGVLALVSGLRPARATTLDDLDWTVLKPKAVDATEGTQLRILDDGSVLASGGNPNTSVYMLELPTDLQAITALRVEVMTHATMPGNGPGRAFNGNLVLTEVTAEIQGVSLLQPEPLTFRNAVADHSQTKAQGPGAAIDGDFGPENGWCPEGQTYHATSTLVVQPLKAFGWRNGTIVRIKLHFTSRWEQHAAGRVRVSASTRTEFDRLIPVQRGPADEAIERSVERGIQYLLKLQQSDGSWFGPDGHMYPVGMTGLAVHTLLHCGLKREHPSMRAAMAYILSKDPIRTYDIGCALMAIHEYGEPFPRDVVKTLTKRLLDALGNGDNDNPAIWGYPRGYGYPNDNSNHLDLSNTQYALLGLRAAAACGEKISPAVFDKAGKSLLQMQGDYGSFSYRPGERPTSSMAAAGMTGLLICRDELAKGKGFDGSVKKLETGLAKCEEWLRSNWSVDENLEVPRNPNPNFRWYYYYIYGLERVGSIWMKRLLGGHDWYAEGAAAILKRQAANGSWATEYGESDSNTCFALLFITRASSSTGSSLVRRAEELGLDKVSFVVRATPANPLIAWVGELRAPIQQRLERGERVAGVDWVVNGSSVGTVKLPEKGNPLLERFALQHTLDRNGRVEIYAIMRFINAEGAEVGKESSNLVSCMIDDIADPRSREMARDAGKNLIAVSGSSAVATSEFDGNFAPRFAVDGRAPTSWLPKPDDPNPTLKISSKRSVVASVVKMVQAQVYGIVPNDWARAKEIEVQINGEKPKRYFLLDDPSIKQRVLFKPQTVKQVRITVKSWYEGFGQPKCAGFKEVELYANPAPDSEGEVTAFSAMETLIPFGVDAKSEWRFATIDPGPEFARVEFDDQAFVLGAAPFTGGNGAAKGNTPWESTKLWVRREFMSPEKDTATYALSLSIDDKAEVFVNGTWVGAIADYTRGKPQGMTIPPGIVKPGKNIIAIRVEDTGGARAFDGALFRYVP